MIYQQARGVFALIMSIIGIDATSIIYHPRVHAQHVFPLSMLKLLEHEWEHMVSDVADASAKPKFAAFEAGT